MYSPGDLPSRTRAAPAKNRIWSTIGAISSDRVSEIGLPVFSHSICDEFLGVRLDEVGELEQRALPLARGGPPPGLERLGRRLVRVVDVFWPESSARWRTPRRSTD